MEPQQGARARRLPRTVSYLVAVSATLVAAFARYQLDSIFGSKVPYILFYPAVALAAWLGGLGAGLVATALSTVCALLFLPPVGSLRVDDPSDLIGLALFSLINVFIAILNETLHRARRRAEVARDCEMQTLVALLHSEERLRSVITCAPDAIITIDAGHKITLFNVGAEAIFGYSANEMIGRTLDQLIAERFREVHRRHIEAFGATGESMRSMGGVRVLAGLRRNGEEFPMEARLSQVEVGGGKLYTVILRDLTEQKRAEVERERLRAREQATERAAQMARQALTATEARAAAIVNAALDPIITIDDEGRVMEFNPAAEKTFGYARDEATGRPLADLIIPPALRERHRAGLARYLTRGESEILGRQVELTAMRSDGSEFPVELTVVPLQRGDQAIFTGFVRDITERRRAETKREELLAVLQRELMLSFAEDTLTDRPFNDLLHWLASHVCDIVKAEAVTILLVGSEGTFDVRVTASRGKRLREHEPLPYEKGFAEGIARKRRLIILNEDQIDEQIREEGVRSMAGVPLLSTYGRVLGVLQIGTAQPQESGSQDMRLLQLAADRVAFGIERARRRLADHRARSKAEAAAKAERDARETAEAANRAKDAFLAIVSHELRTPLSTILIWARMLQREEALGPEKVTRAMEVIERSARSQAQLIEDLLDVSRIVAGKMRLAVRPVMVARVIEKAVDIVQPAADAKGVRLRTVFDTEVGAVLGDAERLQQVVWNLLSNAVKFTPKHGRVQVALERVNSQIEIAVSDTGQGIDPAFLPHVFERFRQAEVGPSRAHGGLGLGLAIVRHIIEAHGGTVHAESPGPGRGAVFTVKLPLMARTAGEAERPHPTAGLAANDRDLRRLDGLRILLVDDELDSNEALGNLLASCGADVREAGSAAHARDILARWKADVLVSDIGMPGEDGYGFIASLRAKEAGVGQIPAIALTAYASREDKVRLLEAGFQAHIPKPPDAAELVDVIASLGCAVGTRQGTPAGYLDG